MHNLLFTTNIPYAFSLVNTPLKPVFPDVGAAQTVIVPVLTCNAVAFAVLPPVCVLKVSDGERLYR